MTDVLAVRSEYRLQSWMEIIRECQESGLSTNNGLKRPAARTFEATYTVK